MITKIHRSVWKVDYEKKYTKLTIGETNDFFSETYNIKID